MLLGVDTQKIPPHTEGDCKGISSYLVSCNIPYLGRLFAKPYVGVETCVFVKRGKKWQYNPKIHYYLSGSAKGCKSKTKNSSSST
mmetsp:Transcript_32963/g.75907  ORF Transcript_32963/g.75907 Transcript_32963/m.75907 type:complete len:85 (-) Transcript_32963:968-1222(-)